MIMRCLQLSPQLRDGWSCLQDLLHYTWGIDTYTQAAKEVDFISTRLIGSGIDELIRVGETYKRWKAPIATALAKNQTELRLTNGKMEGLNNQIKTIIKKAYGYRNFERFRKRALLILWNRKDKQ
jgi:transposase